LQLAESLHEGRLVELVGRFAAFEPSESADRMLEQIRGRERKPSEPERS
jgi:hypothetical protein